MKNSRFLLVAALGSGLLTAAPLAARADAQAPLGVLNLSANASVDVAKDLLDITFATTKEGSDANAVQAQLKQALDAGLAEAKKVARPGQLDVQTGNFSLYPRYASSGSSGRTSISGWQGTAEMTVEGRDMAAIGQLTGRITTMAISRVSYRLSREASQKVEADVSAEAISRYRAKAADYAKQFGYAGFTIREVSVGTNEPMPGPIPMMAMRSALAQAPSDALAIEPGKATVTATVSGTVQMK
jgi:predicted secreted protein